MYILHSIIIENIVSHENTHYVFNQGKPTIIVGRNEDDPSQKANGSGKSGIVEAINIAFTGDSVKNVSMKKLVRRGCEEGKITLDMYNTMYKSHIKIERTLYAGGKAQQVKIWQDSKPVDTCADVNAYNKYIFDMLDIAKEDFEKFYLITKKNYKPFLEVGDTVKKEIINRFSGADKVDQVFPHIDSDVAFQTQHKTAIEEQIARLQGKQELLGDQIIHEENMYTEEAKKKQLSEYQEKAYNCGDNINYLLIEIEENYQPQLTLAKEDQKTFKPIDYAGEINVAKNQYNVHQVDIKKNNEALLGITAKYKAQYDECEAEKKACRANLIRYNADIKECEEIIAELNNKLAGVIQCPECEHNFSLAEKDFDPAAATITIKECSEIITENQQLIKDEQAVLNEVDTIIAEIDKDADTERQTIRTTLEGLNVKSIESGRETRRLENLSLEQDKKIKLFQTTIDDFETKIADTKRSIEKNEAEIKEWEAAIRTVESGKSQIIDKLQEQLEKYFEEESELNDKLSTVNDVLQNINEWYTNFKNFKSYLANQSIKNIEDYSNMYLQQMGTNISIAIEGYKVLSNKKLKEQISTVVMRNGFPEDEYGTFSGGEKGRIDVACILAIQSLINHNSTAGGLDLLIADEIFDSIDASGLESTVNGLQSVNRTVLLVSQNEINTLAESTLIIQKKNKISTILCTSELIQGKTEALPQSTKKAAPSSKSSPSSEKEKAASSTVKKSTARSGQRKKLAQ